MTKLYNATAHDQRPYLDDYRRLGFEVVNPEPQVKATPPTFEAQVEEGKRVASLIPEGANVLIGGAQIIMETIICELANKNCRFFTALSERIRTEDGSFKFNLKSITETLFSRKIRENTLKIEK